MVSLRPAEVVAVMASANWQIIVDECTNFKGFMHYSLSSSCWL